jgi:membrane-bound metal-dependent hydrolase YbcI (DUF457 family)
MFIGHFGVAFGAKRAAPSVSLGVLFAASELADLIWPNLVLLGIERVDVRPGITVVTPLDFVSYPYSHSLAALCVWAIAAAAAYMVLRRSRLAAAATIALLVVSHWILDVATHRPDMPLIPGGTTRLGLGLWNSLWGTLVVEAAMFAGGLAIYLRSTTARSRAGTIGLWSLVAFLLITYLGALFGPPPPSAAAVAWSAEAVWLLAAWAAWSDGARSVREEEKEERPESRRLYQ